MLFVVLCIWLLLSTYILRDHEGDDDRDDDGHEDDDWDEVEWE